MAAAGTSAPCCGPPDLRASPLVGLGAATYGRALPAQACPSLFDELYSAVLCVYHTCGVWARRSRRGLLYLARGGPIRTLSRSKFRNAKNP